MDWPASYRYPSSSMIDVLITRYDALQLDDMEREHCLKSEEELEELEDESEVLWTAWGLEEIHTLYGNRL